MVRLPQRREPGAFCSPGRAFEHALTGELLERNATCGKLRGNKCGVVGSAVLSPASDPGVSAGVHTVWL